MRKYKTVYKEVEVDVELADFDTEDLIEELESRAEPIFNKECTQLIEKIWMKRRLGNNNYQEELDQLIYQILGHIV